MSQLKKKKKANHPNLFFVNKELPLDDTFGSPYYYSGKREMRARQTQDARITIITPNNSSTTCSFTKFIKFGLILKVMYLIVLIVKELISFWNFLHFIIT